MSVRWYFRQNFVLIYCRYHTLSRVVRKPAFCICENKDADQLRGNREANQRLCFRYIDSTIRNFKPLTIFCSCTAWFVSEQVGNPEDRFSRNEAPFVYIKLQHHIQEHLHINETQILHHGNVSEQKLPQICI